MLFELYQFRHAINVRYLQKTILGQRTGGEDLALDMDFENEELHSPFVAKTIDRNEQYEEETHDEDIDDDNATWRGFVDIEDDLEHPDFEIDEEFDDEPEDVEENEVQDEEDDFEYVSADDYDADDDYDEDDETDETDDDF